MFLWPAQRNSLVPELILSWLEADVVILLFKYGGTAQRYALLSVIINPFRFDVDGVGQCPDFRCSPGSGGEISTGSLTVPELSI